MRLDNIKTTAEFYKFADNWYQRAHRLREVWQDETEPLKRRIHAHILWFKMLQRVQGLFQIAIQLNQVNPKNFEKGTSA